MLARNKETCEKYHSSTEGRQRNANRREACWVDHRRIPTSDLNLDKNYLKWTLLDAGHHAFYSSLHCHIHFRFSFADSFQHAWRAWHDKEGPVCPHQVPDYRAVKHRVSIRQSCLLKNYILSRRPSSSVLCSVHLARRLSVLHSLTDHRANFEILSGFKRGNQGFHNRENFR